MKESPFRRFTLNKNNTIEQKQHTKKENTDEKKNKINEFLIHHYD